MTFAVIQCERVMLPFGVMSISLDSSLLILVSPFSVFAIK
jgi:hypothetical protein